MGSGVSQEIHDKTKNEMKQLKAELINIKKIISQPKKEYDHDIKVASREIKQYFDIASEARNNNILLIGWKGMGKTTLMKYGFKINSNPSQELKEGTREFIVSF